MSAPSLRDILKLATVQVIVPQRTDSIPLKESKHDHNDHATSILDGVQRDRLFFDENLKLYAVLSLPECVEDKLQSVLSRLQVSVEVWATSGNGDGSRPPTGVETGRELLCSQSFKKDEDPLVLVTEDDEHQVWMHLVWEGFVPLTRPRTRLVDPHITLISTASVRPATDPASHGRYLEPFTTQESNIFQPLFQAKGFEDDAPFLPVSKLQPVTHRPTEEHGDYHIRAAPTRPIKASLALVARLKLAKAWRDEHSPALTACLDLEMLPYAKVHGRIEAAELKMTAGTVVDLTKSLLPLECRSRDGITLLYHLSASKGQDPSRRQSQQPIVDALAISIRFILELSADCKPELSIGWTTNVDFSQSHNMVPVGASQILHRSTRPPDLHIATAALTTQTIDQPSDYGNHLTVSFSAPVGPVKVGVPFSWRVVVVNHSAKVARLALIPLPKLQRSTSQAHQYARRHASKTSTASNSRYDKAFAIFNDDMAQAHVDENIVYAMQHSAATPSETEVMSLTSELSIGPLGPNQCHEDEIKLVAYKSGVFTLDAVRFVTINRESQENIGPSAGIVDIRDLPDIFAEE